MKCIRLGYRETKGGGIDTIERFVVEGRGMSLRIREGSRRFRFYSLDPGDRDRVLKQLSRDLDGRRGILLAVVYGGFVEHDIYFGI